MADGQDNATPGIEQAGARQVLIPHAVRERPGGLARIPGRRIAFGWPQLRDLVG